MELIDDSKSSEIAWCLKFVVVDSEVRVLRLVRGTKRGSEGFQASEFNLQKLHALFDNETYFR